MQTVKIANNKNSKQQKFKNNLNIKTISLTSTSSALQLEYQLLK